MDASKFLIVAVKGHVDEEIGVLNARGFQVVEVDLSDLLSAKLIEMPSVAEQTIAILRSPRLKHHEYENLYLQLQEKNIILINTPSMVRNASEFELHYPLIQGATPKSIVSPADVQAKELINEIRQKGLSKPIFIKTELKSLKSDSIVIEPTTESIQQVLDNIRIKLPGYNRIITREMIGLRKLQNDPDTVIEYRAFVLNGKIINIQNGTVGKVFPQLTKKGLDFYNKWIEHLRDLEFSNFYIMDIALLETKDEYTIIEIKDGQYTKIRDINNFVQHF